MIGETYVTPRGKHIEIMGEWGGCWLLQVAEHESYWDEYQLVMPKLQVEDLVKAGHYKKVEK